MKGYLLILLSFLGTTMFSQSTAMKHFTVEDGLPSNTVYDVLQDSDGMIWFSTDHGVCQYDGRSFIRYTTADGLPDNEIFRMRYDSKGRIWFVTQNGIPGFYHGGKFYAPSSDLTTKERGLLGRCQEDAKGTIWLSWANLDYVCLSESGILSDPYETHKDLLSDTRITNSIVDTSKNIWLVLNVKSENESRYEIVNVSSQKRYSINSKRKGLSRGLSFDSENRLLQLTGNKLRRYQINEQEASFELIDSFVHPTEVIIAVNEDNKKEQILLGSWDGAMELSKLDFSTNTEFLKRLPVSQMRQDEEGNQWITTLSDGVYFRATNAYAFYTTHDGLMSDKLNVVKHSPKAEIWVGSQPNWLSIIKDEEIRNIQLPYQEGARAMIKDIDFLDEGVVVVTGDQGIYEMKEEKLIRSSPTPAIDFNWASNGKIYITTRSGHILELDQSDYDRIYDSDLTDFQIQKWKEKSIKTILTSDSQLIHGGYDRMQKISLPDYAVTDLSESKQNILDFDRTNSGIWASTNGGGILHFKDNSYVRYTVKDGLLSNSCQTILSRNDTIFIGSNQGLSVMTPSGNSYQIRNFQAPEYLSSNQVYDLHLNERELLLATAKGLSVFQLERLNDEPENLPFEIKSVRINGQQTPFENGMQLRPDQNNLSIHIYAQNYQNARGITYRYRLGPQQEWIPNENGEIILSSLSQGSYSLEAQPVYNGHPLEQSIQLQFHILSPIWKRSWFIFFSILLLVSIMGIIFYLRIRFVTKREEEKRRILEANKKALRSQMNPHFIFNSLNSIQHFILSNDSRLANKYLSKFSKLIRNVLLFSDRESIYLFEEVGLLQDYLDLEKFRLKDKFDYQIEVAPELNMNNCRLPSLVIQPIVENAVWHGVAPIERKGDINIRFYAEGKMLKCSVSDNGNGKKSVPNKKTDHKSIGLTKTQERIKLWNERSEYDIQFIDRKELLNEDGTQVIISLPLIVETSQNE